MGGNYNFALFESSPNAAARNLLGQSLMSNVLTVNGGSGINQNVSGEAQHKSTRRIKIFFILTFDHAELTKKVLSPYYAFNPFKEDNNGKQIYKSPMVRARMKENIITVNFRLNSEESDG